MESFYYITTIVLIGMFFVSLALILYISYGQISKNGGFDVSKPYPPVQQKCPDLWAYREITTSATDTTEASTSIMCEATLSTNLTENRKKNLGSFVNQNGQYDGSQLTNAKNAFKLTSLAGAGTPVKIQFNPEDKAFSNNTALQCGQKQFAKMMNIYWEGIDNYGPC